MKNENYTGENLVTEFQPTLTHITSDELLLFEELFSKISNEFGSPICILNGQIADGWHIGIYEKKILDEKGKRKDGRELGRNLSGANIESIILKLKQQPTP